MAKISAALRDLPARPHSLYRFYDQTDVLLYVGITADLGARLKGHRRDKPWWAEIANVSVTHYATRAEVLHAEAAAIQTERPLYNVAHNELVPVPTSPEASIDPDAEPCGEDCDHECFEHHGDDHWAGRNYLAIEVIDSARGILGDDQRLTEAKDFAARELLLPASGRQYPHEDSSVALTAIGLMDRLASDVWRFRHFSEMLVGAISHEVREEATARAAADWEKAGEAGAPREDQLPDVIRHLADILGGRRPLGYSAGPGGWS